MKIENDNSDSEPPSSKLLTALIWIAIISACALAYILAGKGAIQETKPQYRQFFDTSFYQGDYEPFPRYQVLASISAYTPRVQETDSTPFINAAGEYVMNGDIACPSWLPLYTIVSIGDEKYVCKDRMGEKYRHGNYFDIFMWQLEDARAFGRQTQYVNIY